MELVPGASVTADISLVRPLRKGAMGSVWVAHHARLGAEIAVKLVAHRDRNVLARFHREAEAVAQLRHPNVVRILEHGSALDGTPFIAMELLSGETLEARLGRAGRLALPEVCHVARHVGSALDAAHARGIVHRDVKPDNVFLLGADFPDVKVLDFGMAKQVRVADGEVTATGVAVGTPEYMSPEQVLGSKDVDHRTDLWAFGVVIFRMMAGRSPFLGDTPQALLFGICKGAFPPLSDVGLPIELEPWFKRVFAPNKERRFASAREMIVRLDAHLRDAAPDLGIDDEAATQLFDSRSVFGAPSEVPSDSSESRPPLPSWSSPAQDLSALRAADMDWTDEAPTFQLTTEQADRLRAEARARAEDEHSPLPLLKPRSGVASEGAEGGRVASEPSTPRAVAEQAEPASAEAGVAFPRGDRPVSPGAGAAGGAAALGADASSEAAAGADASGEQAVAGASGETASEVVAAPEPERRSRASGGEFSPHEVPGSLLPASPRSASARVVRSRRIGGAWKIGAAAGLLAAGIATVVIVQEEREARRRMAAPGSSPPVTAATSPPASPTGAATPETTSEATEQRPAKLSIHCRPACLQVRLDGEAVGPSPVLDRRVEPGRHEIVLLRVGDEPKAVHFRVRPGQHFRWREPVASEGQLDETIEPAEPDRSQVADRGVSSAGSPRAAGGSASAEPAVPGEPSAEASADPSATDDPDAPAPTDPEALAPDAPAPDAPAPTDPEALAPDAPETPAPTDPEAPAPDVPEAPAPSDPDAPSSTGSPAP